MTTDAAVPNDHGEEALDPNENYLKAGKGLGSWLLTLDHKRIGICVFDLDHHRVLRGRGVCRCSICAELFTYGNGAVNTHGFMTAETYNRMFTLHGAIMVFLFIIPSIPAAMGNFLLLDRRLARRMSRFPRLNLLSFYIYVVGAIFVLYSVVSGAVGHLGMDVLHALQHHDRQQRGFDGAWRIHHGVLVDSDRAELHRYHPQASCARACIGSGCRCLLWGIYADQHHSGVAATPVLAITAAPCSPWSACLDSAAIFDPALGRGPGALPALLLVPTTRIPRFTS